MYRLAQRIVDGQKGSEWYETPIELIRKLMAFGFKTLQLWIIQKHASSIGRVENLLSAFKI